MTTVIAFFTGTGNSLHVARGLAERLQPSRLVPIPRAMDGSLAETERLGIVFPVYFAGLPLIVAEFFKKVRPAPYTFAVSTHGGMPGFALHQADSLIRAEGRSQGLAAGWAVQLPGNYTRLYGAIPDDMQRRMFAAADGRVAEIARAVQAGEHARIEGSAAPLRWLMPLLYRGFFASKAHGRDADFRVTEKCNSCGTCARVCPVSDVEMRGGRPVWLGHCEQCYACLQWCPQEAIQVGEKTVGRRRYHHPEVALTDLITLRGA